jgi:hypothetical protein
MTWWKTLQPSWRLTDAQVILPHSCELPSGETWQDLRKGGSAGIYFVVMGLSWWVKAQLVEHDVNAWSIVDDLTWVIQEMKKYRASTLTPSPQKRRHDGEDEEEGQHIKRKKVL